MLQCNQNNCNNFVFPSLAVGSLSLMRCVVSCQAFSLDHSPSNNAVFLTHLLPVISTLEHADQQGRSELRSECVERLSRWHKFPKTAAFPLPPPPLCNIC